MAAPGPEKGYAVPPITGWWAAPEDEETPELRWPQSVEVYDRMRRQDGQVISVLRAVTLPIRRTAWSISPEGCRPEVAEFVADCLGLPLHGQGQSERSRSRERFSWTDHLRMSLTALVFGHAFFEQVYEPAGGMYRLRKLAWRPPRTIREVKVASDGGLVSIQQHDSKSPINVDRLVAYVNDREGGNWLGQSMLRPAYKYWLLKDRALRVQSTTLARNGLGVPIFTAPPAPEQLSEEAARQFVDEQIAAGEKLAMDLRSGEEAGAGIANGSKLELVGVSGTLPDAEKPIRYYDEQIARSVLAHFLNLGTETGSWALGSTFADFFTMSLQTVAEWVTDVTNQHVIEDLVDVNFGESEPAPKLVFEEIGSQQPATAEAIQRLIACGAIRADDRLEQYLRSRYTLPAADPETTREAPGADAADPNLTPGGSE